MLVLDPQNVLGQSDVFLGGPNWDEDLMRGDKILNDVEICSLRKNDGTCTARAIVGEVSLKTPTEAKMQVVADELMEIPLTRKQYEAGMWNILKTALTSVSGGDGKVIVSPLMKTVQEQVENAFMAQGLDGDDEEGYMIIEVLGHNFDSKTDRGSKYRKMNVWASITGCNEKSDFCLTLGTLQISILDGVPYVAQLDTFRFSGFGISIGMKNNEFKRPAAHH